jgi:hypothetical protein
MPISPEYLPAELHYIIPLAERHGTDARVTLYDRRLGRHVEYAEKLSAAEIEPLRHLYTKIRDSGHAALINQWYQGYSGKKTCPPETTWPVYGLLCLFRQLGNRGIAPFNDGAVGPEERKAVEVLDWSKLPPDLHYLAEPAARYGHIQFESRIMDFLEREATDADRTALRMLRPLVLRDENAIDAWIDQLGITKHREAALVYFLLHLLALGHDAGLL